MADPVRPAMLFFLKSDAFARQDFRRLSGNKKVVIDGGMAVRVKNCQG
ncbi:hypothetical protein [Paraburkholderia sp. XV]|nr:hypothetical protein [Paraburkholderia sp. XV]